MRRCPPRGNGTSSVSPPAWCSPDGRSARATGFAATPRSQPSLPIARAYAHMTALNSWYSHLDAEIFIKEAKTVEDKKYWRQVEKSAKQQTAEHIFPKMTRVLRGRRRIVDRPPLVYHPRDYSKIDTHVRDMFHRYRHTLPEERRVILDRYQIVDIARKVVGVGSVGTRC